MKTEIGAVAILRVKPKQIRKFRVQIVQLATAGLDKIDSGPHVKLCII